MYICDYENKKAIELDELTELIEKKTNIVSIKEFYITLKIINFFGYDFYVKFVNDKPLIILKQNLKNKIIKFKNKVFKKKIKMPTELTYLLKYRHKYSAINAEN